MKKMTYNECCEEKYVFTLIVDWGSKDCYHTKSLELGMEINYAINNVILVSLMVWISFLFFILSLIIFLIIK